LVDSIHNKEYAYILASNLGSLSCIAIHVAVKPERLDTRLIKSIMILSRC
jgi:hypothetical protein